MAQLATKHQTHAFILYRGGKSKFCYSETEPKAMGYNQSVSQSSQCVDTINLIPPLSTRFPQESNFA
jgi:hypothetical protein